jgi:hypothetical protein
LPEVKWVNREVVLLTAVPLSETSFFSRRWRREEKGGKEGGKDREEKRTHLD